MPDNPFFLETLDETGNRYEEEVPRDKEVLPEGVMSSTYSTGIDFGEELSQAPILPQDLAIRGEAPDVGPQSPPNIEARVNALFDNQEVNPKDLAMVGKAPQVGPSGDIDKYEATPFVVALKAAENSIRKGYDDTTGKWTPHTSIEGGTDTLGYGHKLTKREAKGNFVILNREKVSTVDGLTDEQVDDLFAQDVRKSERQLSKDITGFDSLEQKYKDILVNIAFNTGSVKPANWPRLLAAMKRKDDINVRKEMVTSYEDTKGNRVQLTERAAAIADAVLK